jgi:hypothetical protein
MTNLPLPSWPTSTNFPSDDTWLKWVEEEYKHWFGHVSVVLLREGNAAKRRAPTFGLCLKDPLPLLNENEKLLAKNPFTL